MRKIAQTLMWLTLWCDACQILGVMFTGTYGNAKVAAVIQVNNLSVDSHSPDGAAFILFISLWTGALAVCGLLALRKSPLVPLSPAP